MNEILDDFIKSKVTKECYLSIAQASAILSYYELEEELDLLERYYITSEHDDNTKLDKIIFHINSVLHSIINRYGLFLVDNLFTKDLVDLIITINNLENNEDKYSIIEILDNREISEEEIVFELLAFSSGFNSNHWSSVIIKVQPQLINKLRTLFNPEDIEVEINEESVELNKKYSKLLNKVLEIRPEIKNTLSYEYISYLNQLGLDFNIYIKFFKRQINEFEDNFKEIATMLFLIAIISNNPANEKKKLIQEFINEEIQDMKKETSILNEIAKLEGLQ